MVNDQRGKESVENAAHIRQLEYEIQQSLSRIDELNRVIDQKSYELKQRQGNSNAAEDELRKLQ